MAASPGMARIAGARERTAAVVESRTPAARKRD